MNTDPNIPEPTDTELDAQLLNYDPIRDVPGPVQVIGDVRVPEPSLNGLPPEMREAITAKLANVTPGNRDLFEREFILEALADNSRKVRIMAGAGEGATEVQKADAELANEVRLLEGEVSTIQALLAEKRMVDDPVTGEPIETPHHRILGDQRRGYEARLAEIAHQLGRITGPEGEKRLADALAADKKRIRETRDQLAVMKEADALVVRLERDEKVKALAESKLRFQRSRLG